jgi:hypothetical protein
MNIRDRVVTALTPGSAFNANGLIWRSVDALSQFAGVTPEETLELLAGDLSDVAVVRPSQTGKGLLAALKEHVPQAANPGQNEQVAVLGGPALNPPPVPLEEEVEGPVPEPLDEPAPGEVPGPHPEEDAAF